MRSMRRDKGIVVDTDKGVSGGAESEPTADASLVEWVPASVSGLLPVALSLAVSLFLSDEAPPMAVEPSMIDAADKASKGRTGVQGCPGEPAITIGRGGASRFNRGRWASDGLGRTRWSAFGVCEVESGGALDQAGGGGDGTLVASDATEVAANANRRVCHQNRQMQSVIRGER